jgi:hypothetical protein
MKIDVMCLCFVDQKSCNVLLFLWTKFHVMCCCFVDQNSCNVLLFCRPKYLCIVLLFFEQNMMCFVAVMWARIDILFAVLYRYGEEEGKGR